MGALLYTVFSQVPVAAVWQVAKAIEGKVLLLSAIFLAVSCLFRAVDWRYTTFECERKLSIMALLGGVMLAYLAEWRLFIILFIWIAGAWVCNYLSIWVLIANIVEQSWQAALLLLVFVNCSLLIPASLGAFGVMQVAFLAGLHPFVMPNDQALVLSFVYQAGLYGVSILGAGLTNLVVFMSGKYEQ
jgi:uncharacterized membrane protein YbhN (UPF0104 family)